DRMFDLGFIKDIRFLLRRMPIRTERQTLLFSATLSHRVLELAYEHMNEPEKVVVEAETVTAARVRQKLYYPADEEKLPLLLGLLSRSEGARTMVFVNTKVYVERVARALEKAGYRVGVLSGDVPQKKRESLLRKFQAGQLEILVATDVAARGLHIEGVSHVYNYDLPFDAEDYVHRIGRTARLGAEGDAISFACERYAIGLPDIEAYIGQKIPSEPVTPDLLVPVPRQPRAAVPAGDDDGDSIGEIYREVREARAAEDAKRGGGRGPRGAGSRGQRPDGDGERPRKRRTRKPRPDAVPAAAAAADAPPSSDAATPAAPAPVIDAAAALAAALPHQPRPPRARAPEAGAAAAGRGAGRPRAFAALAHRRTPAQAGDARAAGPALAGNACRRGHRRHRRPPRKPGTAPRSGEGQFCDTPGHGRPALRPRQQAVPGWASGAVRSQLRGSGRRDAVPYRAFGRRQEHPAQADPPGRAPESRHGAVQR